jgi:hypothetical protein
MFENIADILSISAWHSVWVGLDKWLVPEDIQTSSFISFGIGILTYSILYVLNGPISRYCSKNMSDDLVSQLKAKHVSHDMPLKVDKSMTMAMIAASRDKDINVNFNETIGVSRIILLNLCFTWALFSTVNSWRAVWALQNVYMYPLIVSSNFIINLLVLHFVYLIITIGVLSSLNTVCASMSRAGCEDDLFYFGASGLLSKNLFRLFFMDSQEDNSNVH